VANLNQTFAKVVYESHPEITTAQLLCYRAITCVLIQLLWLNNKTKHYMIDCVTRKNMVPIVVRMTQVSVSILVSYTAVKYFQLTTVTMVQQLSPMVTVIMAYFILGETLKGKQIGVLFFAFFSVCLVVLGGTEQDRQVYEQNFFALIMLLMNPVLVAFGMVA
jgi:drug/metabolite transporter (DMT)-like permease